LLRNSFPCARVLNFKVTNIKKKKKNQVLNFKGNKNQVLNFKIKKRQVIDFKVKTYVIFVNAYLIFRAAMHRRQSNANEWSRQEDAAAIANGPSILQLRLGYHLGRSHPPNAWAGVEFPARSSAHDRPTMSHDHETRTYTASLSSACQHGDGRGRRPPAPEACMANVVDATWRIS
jgi:hypothetical protein